MAHLTYLNRSDLPEEERYILERNINLDRIVTHSLPVARFIHGLGDWIRFHSSVDPRLREMVILQVGYMARNAYEVSHHVKIGQDFGVSELDLAAIILETEGRTSTLPQLDRLVLQATREIFINKAMSTTTVELLKNRFSASWIVELVAIIGYYEMLDTLIKSLAVDVEESWAAYLEKMPLNGKIPYAD